MKFISNTEREFIMATISTGKRLDGRKLTDGRSLSIKFCKEWGGCISYLGKTAVFAQASAKVTQPKLSNISEGIFEVNYIVSPMSSPSVNLSRSSDEWVELQRSLERCLRDSKCLDLESLCIVAGLKVWTIRVDIRALNNDGNLLECSSVAAISALLHFRRPDVCVVGREITVNITENRDPVPLNINHKPIAITLALFCKGPYVVVDPTESEEQVADGSYIIVINDRQEVCTIHKRGSFCLDESTFRKCLQLAVDRAESVIQAIHRATVNSKYILCPNRVPTILKFP